MNQHINFFVTVLNIDEMSVVGIDANSDRILFYNPEVDPDEDLSVRMSLLKPFPFVEMRADLKDAYCFVMKRWILDEMDLQKTRHPNLKDDFIPFLVKAQSRPCLLSAESREKIKDKFAFLKDSAVPVIESEAPLHCGIYILKSGFCMRVKSFASYQKANLQVIFGYFKSSLRNPIPIL